MKYESEHSIIMPIKRPICIYIYIYIYYIYYIYYINIYIYVCIYIYIYMYIYRCIHSIYEYIVITIVMGKR